MTIQTAKQLKDFLGEGHNIGYWNEYADIVVVDGIVIKLPIVLGGK